MTQTQITLSNDFHNTEVQVSAQLDRRGRWILPAAQVSRTAKILCRIAGCTCGDTAGTRGRQLQPSGDQATLEYFASGDAEVILAGCYA